MCSAPSTLNYAKPISSWPMTDSPLMWVIGIARCVSTRLLVSSSRVAVGAAVSRPSHPPLPRLLWVPTARGAGSTRRDIFRDVRKTPPLMAAATALTHWTNVAAVPPPCRYRGAEVSCGVPHHRGRTRSRESPGTNTTTIVYHQPYLLCRLETTSSVVEVRQGHKHFHRLAHLSHCLLLPLMCPIDQPRWILRPQKQASGAAGIHFFPVCGFIQFVLPRSETGLLDLQIRSQPKPQIDLPSAEVKLL